MKKLLHLNSFFTKIILAILSFAVIICIFIPYAQIPAVDSVRDIDTANSTFSVYLGKETSTYNFVSAFCNAQPYQIFADESLSEESLMNNESLPTPDAENIYYLATYVYGYDASKNASGDDKQLEYVYLDTYKVILNKDKSNKALTIVTRDVKRKTITVRVPNATAFDFTRVIDKTNPWYQYKNNSLSKRYDDVKSLTEVRSMEIPICEDRQYKQYNVGLTLRSETTEENSTAETAAYVYYPLNMYTLAIMRDPIRKTLPTVAEIGGGLLSNAETNENYSPEEIEAGNFKISSKDTFMFVFMILAAVTTLCAFIISNKLKFIEMGFGIILGGGLIAMPILDWVIFYSKHNFGTEIGWIVLMVLGVLIILASVFDCYRCRSEYKEEQIRIYGADVFKKKK